MSAAPERTAFEPRSLGHDLRGLFRDELELCKLAATETLAVAHTTETPSAYLVAARLAAEQLGARIVDVPLASQATVRMPSIMRAMGAPGTVTPESLAAILAADMLLDLTPEGLLWLPAMAEILEAGVRTLMVTDPPEALQRMFPTREVRRRVEANSERLARARSMHVTCEAGSDFTCELGQYPPRGRYGYTDEPGHWDHWPSAMTALYPTDGTANGVLVLKEGDVPLPFMRYVSSPVRLTFAHGCLEAIEGGFDARLIREFIASWDDPAGLLISHVGWGLNRRANWAAVALFGGERMYCQDIRTFEGNFLFSTGPNELAGRFTPCHLDFACRDTTLLLDGELILEAGSVKPAYLQ
jgi:2,5-dihydroxypyridine 5,6-dioxygenase